MADWANQLADYGIEFEPRVAIKAQALADFIAETTGTGTEQSSNQTWKLYVDGSSTANSGGAGILIVSSAGVRMEHAVKFTFAATNNEAEYEALLLGIEICQAAGAKNVEAHSDSQLIVGQVNGEFEAKDESMKMYLTKVKEQVGRLDTFSLIHIPRSENAQADALSHLASSAQGVEPWNIIWEVLPRPSINAFIGNIDRSDTWMTPYIDFHTIGKVPDDPAEVPLFLKKAKWFEYFEGVLYKKSYTHPLLKCVTPTEGDYILKEIHEGSCGIHQGARTVIGKVLRSGYYWPTLKSDAEKMVKCCTKCQFFAEIPRKPASYLSPMQAVLPFDKWGLDILGPFPAAKGQKRWVIVGIDYFSKYVEAEALNSITDRQVQQFIWRNIITRYGVPRALISDNGRQFNSGPTRQYCARFGIQTRFSSVSRPQTNGQAESANKVILRGIKTKLDGALGNWLEELPGILWSVRTTVKEATGHTPFSLVFGSEAVLPVEIGIPSTRIAYYDYEDNQEQKKVNLDLLPETRGNALLRALAQKQKMTRYFNQRVKPRQLQLGDYVLRKVEATSKATQQGKLGQNWEGPYKIVKVVKPSTFELQDQQGRMLPRPWNADHLKKFYF